MTDRPRALRADSTDAEKKLWARLRNNQLGVKFRRQHALGRYVADFACIEHQLIVELDGGQHGERFQQDEARTDYLERLGFRVVRFWNPDVLREIEVVLDAIHHELNSPHPNPLPASGARESDVARESKHG